MLHSMITVHAPAVAGVLVLLAGLVLPALGSAQGRRGGGSPGLAQAAQLMRDGRTAEALAAARREAAASPASVQVANLLDTLGAPGEARAIFQRAIDAAPDAAARAAAERGMAMSYAFDGDCKNTVVYEERVIAYWKTREQAEPQNAFYQQGEMANEAARVCIDAGDLDTAEQWYRTGTDLGLREPGHATHPKSLWDYRLAHALGRLAARRGNAAEASRQVAAARAALDADPVMAEQQERFFPYLTGYVALYTNDWATAEADLVRATETPGNQSDPFMRYLLGLARERQGKTDLAKADYDRALALATAHNPPAAFVRHTLRERR
jgi:tetratricopeptide (TPR) repeat protein